MTKTVACLAGDGVGPELMAAATRALDRVAALHHFDLDDRHLPFAGEAVTRSGHPAAGCDARRVPQRRRDPRRVSRRAGVRGREGRPAPRLARRARAHRAGRRRRRRGSDRRLGHRDRRAPRLRAARRRGAGASSWSATRPRGSEAVAAERAKWDGLEVEQATLGETLVRLREDSGSLDVIATEAHLVDALVDAAAAFAGSHARGRARVAPGRRPWRLRALAAPPRTTSPASASSTPPAMLLATSLMLAEGLQRRSASRTLERAVGIAVEGDGQGRDTRAFTDAVIALLPQSRIDLEHVDEALR